jgi:hypothetical protein
MEEPIMSVDQARYTSDDDVDPGHASTADLVNRATAQMSTLVRDELALARAELVAKGKRAGVGGGLFGGAALLGLYGLGLVIALAVAALALVWPVWLALLVVAVVVFAAAGVAALMGRSQVRRAVPPTPEEATAGMAADVETVKNALREGRQS